MGLTVAHVALLTTSWLDGFVALLGSIHSMSHDITLQYARHFHDGITDCQQPFFESGDEMGVEGTNGS